MKPSRSWSFTAAAAKRSIVPSCRRTSTMQPSPMNGTASSASCWSVTGRSSDESRMALARARYSSSSSLRLRCFLAAPLLGHVRGEADHRHQLSVGVVNGLDPGLHRDRRAILVEHRKVAVPDLAAPDGPHHALRQPHVPGGDREIDERGGRRLACRPAVDSLRMAVPAEDRSLRVDRDHRDLDEVEQVRIELVRGKTLDLLACRCPLHLLSLSPSRLYPPEVPCG